MWPQQMAWQRADLWEAAHQEKGLCCWWRWQVRGKACSLGRPLPTFVMHEGNLWAYQEQACQKVLSREQSKNRNISLKPSDQYQEYHGGKWRGKQSIYKWNYFLNMLFLWCWCCQTEWSRERLVYFTLAFFPSQSFFFSRVSWFSLLLGFLIQQKREKNL